MQFNKPAPNRLKQRLKALFDSLSDNSAPDNHESPRIKHLKGLIQAHEAEQAAALARPWIMQTSTADHISVPAPAPDEAVTFEGARAVANLLAYETLRRSVLACLLWEDSFYESGESNADRIQKYAALVSTEQLAALAVEARTKFHLRHVSLWLLVALAKRGGRLVGQAIEQTIQRPDEITEFLALYWKEGKKPLAKQVKLGLAAAFRKFDAYALAKYNRAGAVKLRDALFLVHAKPANPEQAELWKQLAEDRLPAPDTWEVALSAGKNKAETFTRLLTEKKLGYLALLRNLRNMIQAGVDTELIKTALLERRGADRVLPFRYVAAARACPQLEPAIDQALLACLQQMPALPEWPENTVVLVDVSGSMAARLSNRSDLTRMDAAAALAAIVPGQVRLFTFSSKVLEVPPRRGMAGVDAIIRSQPHSATELANAIDHVNTIPHQRLIVITDEQATADDLPKPKAAFAYMINVASYKNGVGYGDWTHLDGFSEHVLHWMAAFEDQIFRELD